VVNLYTIANGASGWSDVTITNPGTFRYVRYLSPANSYGNVSEIEFYGMTPAPDTTPPTVPGVPTLSSRSTNSITMSWTASTDAVGVVRYDIFRNGVKVGSSTTNSYTDSAGLSPNTSYSYTVQAFDAAGNASTASNPGSLSTLPLSATLAGTVIGTTGSYNNSGNTRDKVFDGNTSTYFDSPLQTGSWVGLDLGSTKTITSITYYPRANWASRMVGGKFQISTTADFSSGVTDIATITTAPSGWVTITFATPVSARYIRYLSPAGSYGNLSEIEFYGY
jgi:hypothetical protein